MSATCVLLHDTALRTGLADGGYYIKAMRLFKDEPRWTPRNRSEELEGNRYRREYIAACEAQTWHGLEKKM
ncbi:MAG: hypothetical protein M1832_000744 [Thelocarpon impressellum]|nr:MAG: hypothetical protein M1832_000744 [Thelocarpon impressellum]